MTSSDRKTQGGGDGEIESPVRKDESDEHLLPGWIKTTGALVGIIVGLLTASAGIYQVAIGLKHIDENIQKEQRLAEEAKANTAAENRKKAETEARQSAADAEARLELKHKELEIQKTELETKIVAKETLTLTSKKDLDVKNLEEQIAIRGEERLQRREETAKVGEALLGVFGDVSVPNLARLAKYSTPADERLPSILTSLVAKLDQARGPSEVSIIFQLFERAGPSAIRSVVDSNRNAFERYKAHTKKLALVQLNQERKRIQERPANDNSPIDLVRLLDRLAGAILSTQDTNTGLGALQREYIDDVWDQIIRPVSPTATYRELRARDRSLMMSPDWLARLDLVLGIESPEFLANDLSVQFEILRHSKRSLSRLLKQSEEFVDLGGVDLSGLRLPRGPYQPINFSDAFVAGADFSDAELDPGSVETLSKAYVARDRKVTTIRAPSSELRLSQDQLRVIFRSGS